MKDNPFMRGEEMQSLRKAAGLTQAQLAQMLHLSQPFVGEMERGEKAIEPRTAEIVRKNLHRRVGVGTMGSRYTVVLTEPVRGQPGRRHHILPETYDTLVEAEAAANKFCARNVGWRYVSRPVVMSAISQAGGAH